MSRKTRFSFPAMLHDHAVVSGLSVIIGGQDRPFGVLAAYTQENRVFTNDDMNFLQSVANILAAAVDQDLRIEAEKSIREMEDNARHRTLVLETANRVALDILSSRFGTEALRHIADSARVLAGARYAALGKGMYSHCRNGGGWILGNLIDGSQAKYVRIPFADNSLHHIPPGADEEALVMLSDILPTGFECGVLGVHGKPVEFHIERLWAQNITLTTRLVDTVTTPMLLKMVQSGRLDAEKLISHRFKLTDAMEAYDTFGNAAQENALKVILEN